MAENNIFQTENDYSHVAYFLIVHKSQLNYHAFHMALNGEKYALIKFLNNNHEDNFIFRFASSQGNLKIVKFLVKKILILSAVKITQLDMHLKMDI